jgi:hypothetical protein
MTSKFVERIGDIILVRRVDCSNLFHSRAAAVAVCSPGSWRACVASVTDNRILKSYYKTDRGSAQMGADSHTWIMRLTIRADHLDFAAEAPWSSG